MKDSTLVYILVAITAIHFLFGIDYLLYKLEGGSKPPKKNKDNTN
ncbi:hypothetical protein [Ancylomarina longa]|nr:hypothetical protein [Ancylomarina longa]